MNVSIAMPPNWRHDAGCLMVLSTLASLRFQPKLTVTLPEDDRLLGEESRRWRVCAEAEAQPADDEPRLCVLPVSNRCARWALARALATDQPTALFATELASEPPLWPALALHSDGVIVCEPAWQRLLSDAEPRLPTLLMAPQPVQADRGVCLGSKAQSTTPYLLSWMPATVRSIVLVVEAFTLLRLDTPGLQLVVLGGADSSEWARRAQAAGVGECCWFLGADSYARADAIMAGALATIAPLPPSEQSSTLWSAMARSGASPHVSLVAGRSSWVKITAGVPTVPCEGHDAARSLAQALSALLKLGVNDLDHLLALRTRRQSTDGQERTRFGEFCIAAAGRRRTGKALSGHILEDRAAWFGDVTVDAFASLGLDRLTRTTVQAVAQSIAGLAT